MSSSSRVLRIARWGAVAVLGAGAGLLFAVMLTAVGDSPAVAVQASGGSSGAVPVAQTLTDAQIPAGGAVSVVQPASPESASSLTSGLAGPPPVVASDAVASNVGEQTARGLSLSIPSLAVSAEIVDLGFNGDGQLDVPSDGVSVGWYDVSPRPGEPGNALLGGHYDWDGSLAVFWRLGELQQGDVVELDDGTGAALVYEVQLTANVDWDRPLSEILASDDGSSLTLFTCGGAFDQARGEYEQRVVVWATLVEPLASRR